MAKSFSQQLRGCSLQGIQCGCPQEGRYPQRTQAMVPAPTMGIVQWWGRWPVAWPLCLVPQQPAALPPRVLELNTLSHAGHAPREARGKTVRMGVGPLGLEQAMGSLLPAGPSLLTVTVQGLLSHQWVTWARTGRVPEKHGACSEGKRAELEGRLVW